MKERFSKGLIEGSQKIILDLEFSEIVLKPHRSTRDVFELDLGEIVIDKTYIKWYFLATIDWDNEQFVGMEFKDILAIHKMSALMYFMRVFKKYFLSLKVDEIDVLKLKEFLSLMLMDNINEVIEEDENKFKSADVHNF